MIEDWASRFSCPLAGDLSGHTAPVESDPDGLDVLTRCPHRNGARIVAPGVSLAIECGTNRCAYCGPRRAARLARAIAASEPTFDLGLTRIGNSPEEWGPRMARLRSALARRIGAFTWAWVAEENPEGTGFHAHALGRGAMPSRQVLAELAVSQRMGLWVHARPIRDRLDAANYLVKHMADARWMPAGQAEETVGRHLGLNVGRIVRTSHGFLTVNGAPARQKAAIASARAPRPTSGDGSGELVQARARGL